MRANRSATGGLISSLLLHDIHPKITFGPSSGWAGAAITSHWPTWQNHPAIFLTEIRLKSNYQRGATEPSLGITPPQIHQYSSKYLFLNNKQWRGLGEELGLLLVTAWISMGNQYTQQPFFTSTEEILATDMKTTIAVCPASAQGSHSTYANLVIKYKIANLQYLTGFLRLYCA